MDTVVHYLLRNPLLMLLIAGFAFLYGWKLLGDLLHNWRPESKRQRRLREQREREQTQP